MKKNYTKIIVTVFILFIYFTKGYCYKISSARICEDIVDGQPNFCSVVLSSSIKKIYCYTLFEQIKKENFIYHVWYFKDKLMSKVKLKLKPPMWATFSRIYIRESDIGPWRVEIIDENGKLIYILRFSVVE